MPGPHRSEPSVFFQVRIPASLALRVTTLLADPNTGRVRFARKQELIERLLRRWIEEGATL